MGLELPKGLISPKEAKELNQQFIKTRSQDLNKIVKKESGNPKKEDAISSWFSLEEIKKYIAYVESENSNVNGLRVYFGAYSNSDKKQGKKDLSTVFIVPTVPLTGSLQKDGVTGDDDGGSDLDDLEGLNNGSIGNPPSAQYPQ